MRSRFFRMREHGSTTGGAARAAHCPPAARSLLAKNVRPQGTAEGWAAESHIQAAHDCPSPPLAVRPCPRFAAGAPNFSCPPTARWVPTQLLAGPVRKRTGLMRTEAGAGGGAWEREPRDTSAWLSRRDVPPVHHRAPVCCQQANLHREGGRGGKINGLCPVAALSARGWRWAARAPRSGTDRRF